MPGDRRVNVAQGGERCLTESIRSLIKSINLAVSGPVGGPRPWRSRGMPGEHRVDPSGSGALRDRYRRCGRWPCGGGRSLRSERRWSGRSGPAPLAFVGRCLLNAHPRSQIIAEPRPPFERSHGGGVQLDPPLPTRTRGEARFLGSEHPTALAQNRGVQQDGSSTGEPLCEGGSSREARAAAAPVASPPAVTLPRRRHRWRCRPHRLRRHRSPHLHGRRTPGSRRR